MRWWYGSESVMPIQLMPLVAGFKCEMCKMFVYLYTFGVCVVCFCCRWCVSFQYTASDSPSQTMCELGFGCRICLFAWRWFDLHFCQFTHNRRIKRVASVEWRYNCIGRHCECSRRHKTRKSRFFSCVCWATLNSRSRRECLARVRGYYECFYLSFSADFTETERTYVR